MSNLPEPPQTEKNINLFSQGLCVLGGTSLYVLKKCPHEVNRHANLGLVVLVTGFVSGFSMFMLVQSTEEPFYTCLVMAIIWGLLITTVDRYILASYRKQKDKLKEFGSLLPRVIMAACLSVTISGPLELAAFKKDVAAKLIDVKKDRVDEQRKKDRAQLETDLSLYQTQAKTAATEYTNSVKDKYDGSHTATYVLTNPVTHEPVLDEHGKIRTGTSTIYPKRKDKFINKSITDAYSRKIHADSLVTKTQAELKTIDQKTYPDIEGDNGILIKLEALHRVWRQDIFSEIMGYLFFGVLLSFELLPVLFKFFSKETAYDETLQSFDDLVKQRNQWRMDHEKSQILYHFMREKQGFEDEQELSQKVHGARVSVEEQMNTKFLETEGQILDALGTKRKTVQTQLNKELIDEIAAAQKEISIQAITLWKQKKLEELPGNLDQFINELS